MSVDQNAVISSWAQAFPASFDAFNNLITESKEVIVFGSRAAGVQGPFSDLDVLIVIPYKRRIRVSGLDSVVLDPEDVDDPFWLGSELASHVVRFGTWIKGGGEWRDRVLISDRAIARKRQRLNGVLRNASSRWPRLHQSFRVQYATTTRRELQRLDLLMNRMPIPPTPILDALWNTGQVSPASLRRLLDACGELYTVDSVPEFRELAMTPVSFYASKRIGQCHLQSFFTEQKHQQFEV